jgi:hypothetical protein
VYSLPPEYPIVAKFQPPYPSTHIPILITIWEPHSTSHPLIASHHSMIRNRSPVCGVCVERVKSRSALCTEPRRVNNPPTLQPNLSLQVMGRRGWLMNLCVWIPCVPEYTITLIDNFVRTQSLSPPIIAPPCNQRDPRARGCLCDCREGEYRRAVYSPRVHTYIF